MTHYIRLPVHDERSEVGHVMLPVPTERHFGEECVILVGHALRLRESRDVEEDQ